MSSNAIAAVLVVVLLMLVWWWFRSRAAGGGGSAPADRLDTLAAWPPRVTRILTSQERIAHNTLLRAFPDHLVLAQVPLSRFVRVPTRYSHAEWLRRVGQLCADLVVCDTATQPLAVVLVEAPGGAPSERARQRHERMLRVLRAADLRCSVWIENAIPSVEIARATVLGANAHVSTTVAVTPASVMPPAGTAAPDSSDRSQPDSTEPALPDEGEPPPTWYDDLNSGPAPLQPARSAEPRK